MLQGETVPPWASLHASQSLPTACSCQGTHSVGCSTLRAYSHVVAWGLPQAAVQTFALAWFMSPWTTGKYLRHHDSLQGLQLWPSLLQHLELLFPLLQWPWMLVVSHTSFPPLLSLLSSVFCSFLNMFQQRCHHLEWEAQLSPAVSWLELTQMGCLQHGAVPGLFSQKPLLQAPFWKKSWLLHQMKPHGS